MTNEETISNFLKTAYSDERLAEMFAHIDDGKFSFVSCCCLRGAATADHALRSRMGAFNAATEYHYEVAGEIPGAREAELALRDLLDDELTDTKAQEVMLTLVRAEIERRDRERSESSVHSLQTVVV